MCIFTARVRSTREGNVYTWQCLSVHRGVPTLDREIHTLGDLGWGGSTHPGQGGTSLGQERGYLPWVGEGLATLDGGREYLPWMGEGVPTLDCGGGAPTLDRPLAASRRRTFLFTNLINPCHIELQIRKLVLLGDILQLPSIEPGNFLTDTFHAMDTIGCSVLLRTNHRSDGELITANAGWGICNY